MISTFRALALPVRFLLVCVSWVIATVPTTIGGPERTFSVIWDLIVPMSFVGATVRVPMPLAVFRLSMRAVGMVGVHIAFEIVDVENYCTYHLNIKKDCLHF